jgi:hypothetical protein
LTEHDPGAAGSETRRLCPRVAVLVLALLAASGTAFVAPGGAAAARGASLDIRLERTPVIVRESYQRLPAVGAQGQMGVNYGKGCSFSLSHQMAGDLYVRAGIVHGKPSLIEDGFRAFDYAFRRQRDNGSLPADQTEEYAFFVEAVAHSVLLVGGSRYEGLFTRELNRYERRLGRAAPHMIEPDAWSGFRQRNRSYTHTAYTVGTALAMTGKLTGRRRLKRYGREAIGLGLERQRDSGVNPELGGYDVRYQMVGIVYAERYRVYFPGGVGREVKWMVNRGLRWMSGRVDRDGWIDWRGSTRACRERSGFCLEREGPARLKSPGYPNAIRGFAYWGALTGRDGQLARAQSMQRYERNADNLCGPKETIATASSDQQVQQQDRSREAPLRGLLDPAEANDLLE